GASWSCGRNGEDQTLAKGLQVFIGQMVVAGPLIVFGQGLMSPPVIGTDFQSFVKPMYARLFLSESQQNGGDFKVNARVVRFIGSALDNQFVEAFQIFQEPSV